MPVSLQPPGTVDNDSTVTASGFMALRFHANASQMSATFAYWEENATEVVAPNRTSCISRSAVRWYCTREPPQGEARRAQNMPLANGAERGAIIC